MAESLIDDWAAEMNMPASDSDTADDWAEYRTKPQSEAAIEEDEETKEDFERPHDTSLYSIVEDVTGHKIVQDMQFSSLGDIVLDETARQQYQMVLGYVPLNLMNKSVQHHLLRAHPDYKHAFNNRLMIGFLQGITKASIRVCNGMMLLAISRCLLDEVLSRTGFQATLRRDLVDLATELQRRLLDTTRKTQRFVETVAMMIKEMGKVATLLEYGAPSNLLVEKLKKMSVSIDAHTSELRDDQDNSLESLIKVKQILEMDLQSDTKYKEEKAKFDELQVALTNAQNEVISLRNEYWEKRTLLEASLARHKAEVANIGTRKNIASNQIDRCENNLRQANAMITRYQELKVAYQKDHRREIESAKEMNSVLKHAMISVAKSRERVWEAGVQSMNKHRTALNKSALKFRDRSHYASDGVELHSVTSESSSWWGFHKASSTHLVQVNRPNEKLRLERLANEAEASAQEVSSRIEEMNNRGGKQIVDEVKALMDDSLERQRLTNATNDADNRLNSNLARVDGQIGSLQQLRANVQSHLDETKEELEALMGREEAIVEEAKSDETKLLGLNSNEGSMQKRIADAQGREADAVSEFDDQKKLLMAYKERFGNQSDFAVFMRLFGLLNGSIKNLPAAMETLSSAFKGAELTFGHDIFQENLEELPEEGRKQLLRDTAVDMQNVCMIAWDTFETPLLKLVQSDTRAVLDPIVRNRRKACIMEAAQNVDKDNARPNSIQAPPSSVDVD